MSSFARIFRCFEWKMFYAMVMWLPYAARDWGVNNGTLYQFWKTLFPHRMRNLLLKSPWSLVLSPKTLSISLLVMQFRFPSKADGRIILPDLSPQSDKTLKEDEGKLRERKKVTSIRLWDVVFPTHTACAWGKAENNEHVSLVLRACCFFK